MFRVAQQRKMTRPPAAPDPPPEDVRSSNDTTPPYTTQENHEQPNNYEIKAFAPVRATIFRFQNSTTCSNDVGLIFSPPATHCNASPPTNRSSRRNTANSRSTRVHNRTRKPRPPNTSRPSSLCTIFENSPVLVPSLPVHNINNSSSRCNTANSHSMHVLNRIRQPQPPELAPRSSLQPSFPNHPTYKGFSRRKINTSYLPHVRNRTCKLLLPDIPRLASLFTIFEDAPVLVFPPPISHELPEKQPKYSAQALALASNKKVPSQASNSFAATPVITHAHLRSRTSKPSNSRKTSRHAHDLLLPALRSIISLMREQTKLLERMVELQDQRLANMACTFQVSTPPTPDPDSPPVIFSQPTPPPLPTASISPVNHNTIVPPISASSFVSMASLPSNMTSITPMPAPRHLSPSPDHAPATVTSKTDSNMFTITTPATSQSQSKSPLSSPIHASCPDITPSLRKAQTKIPLTPLPFYPPPPVTCFLSSPPSSYSRHAPLRNYYWPFIASSLSLLSRFPLDNFPDHPG